MQFLLTQDQCRQKKEFASFISREIEPSAEEFDRLERIPDEVISHLASRGYLGAVIPGESGGLGMDPVTFGLFCEEIGKASASLLSVITVHSMVSAALVKWGTPSQKERWLPGLAKGETLAAFALTEPGIGSDARNVETNAEKSGSTYILSGHKKWISFGQKATLFLVFAQSGGKPSAFLVERESPGLSIVPMSGLLGFRGAMCAEVHLDQCVVPGENLLGRPGSGFTWVAGTALDQGRYCVAWGCLGLAMACLEASIDYSDRRKQFGSALKEHQLISEMIADMITSVKAAEMLCLKAGLLKERGEPSLLMDTSVAKYFASRAALKAAMDAVQIHGANGCGSEYPVGRYLRDARIMEIIEGSTQIQQLIISRQGYTELKRRTTMEGRYQGHAD
jgi:glutaryl-CoA dehydrogenase (non-decarboxylating)